MSAYLGPQIPETLDGGIWMRLFLGWLSDSSASVDYCDCIVSAANELLMFVHDSPVVDCCHELSAAVSIWVLEVGFDYTVIPGKVLCSV